MLRPSPRRLAVVPCPVILYRRADEPLTRVRVRPNERHTRVRAGVYAEQAAWAVLQPWERYLVRVHAFALLHPDAVFCLESAAVLLGQPVFGEPRDIHVFDPALSKTRRYGDVCMHTSADPRGVRPGTILTTSPGDTALDLMRVLPPAFAVAVADAALRSDPALSVQRLQDLAAGQVARRGAAQLAWLWSRVDAESESVGESVSRTVIEWCGYPPPELQVWFFGEGFEDRVDFFWRACRAIGESDGYGKYSSDPGVPALLALKHEKSREDRLRRQSDGFARWDYADTMRVAPLQRKIATAGVPQLYPVQPAMIRTLRSNPRSLPRP